MSGLDDWLARLGSSGVMALVAASLLGLRHATDPDHLTAVSTLFLSEGRRGPRRATWLGLSWGLGHAVTLCAFGLPVIFFRRNLPPPIQRAAEVAIGLLIAGLAIRLLVRWRRGYFHVHAHSHGAVRHAHPHVHEHALGSTHPAEHAHLHPDSLGRSPLAAFGIGMIHGVGGSAAVGILLVGAIAEPAQRVWALLVFAGATAASMALMSAFFGYALASSVLRRQVSGLVPWLGGASLLFGVWYSVGAILPHS
jgi:ABC-type nickel/cobalt efflux system permease component RcnA